MLKNISQKNQKRIVIFIFSLLPVLLLVVFSYFPLIKMFQYSMTDWDGVSPTKTFVGLDNYKKIITDPTYFTVFKTSIYYFLATIPQLAFALLLATLLSFKIKFSNFYKGAIFFPYLLNGVAIGFIFLYFYKGGGTLDTILRFFGFKGDLPLWLGDRRINNLSLVFTSLWRYTGFNFLIFLGAIQSINPEVYEAADIDGANQFNKFIYIILPAIKNIVFLNLILGVSGALSVFDIPYIMTSGANGTMTFVIQTINTAFKYNKVGLASAMAVILLFIVVVVSSIQKILTTEKKGH